MILKLWEYKDGWNKRSIKIINKITDIEYHFCPGNKFEGYRKLDFVISKNNNIETVEKDKFLDSTIKINESERYCVITFCKNNHFITIASSQLIELLTDNYLPMEVFNIK